MGLIVVGASVEDVLFHQPFAEGLLRGSAIIGGLVVARYLFRYVDPPKRPSEPTMAARQPPVAEERDAFGA